MLESRERRYRPTRHYEKAETQKVDHYKILKKSY